MTYRNVTLFVNKQKKKHFDISIASLHTDRHTSLIILDIHASSLNMTITYILNTA